MRQLSEAVLIMKIMDDFIVANNIGPSRLLSTWLLPNAYKTYFKNVSSQPSFDCLEFKRDSEHSIIQLLNNEL